MAAIVVCCALVVAAPLGADTPAASNDENLISNGNFEQLAPRESSRPAGWYFVQQAQRVEADGAPRGRHFLRFDNAVPGRAARAQQHVRLDGREVRAIDVSAVVATRDVEPGQALAERPAVRVSFYDEDDIELGQEVLGPWSGTRDWSRDSSRIVVPGRARLMLVEIGLGGGTGRADFDDVQVVPAAQNPTALPRRIGK
ncbi:MAG TPA: hypothetical protein VHD36_05705 [Pirellulales bacterium]|nr:hypothetical protein [Pirellulales bacterium]